MSEDWLGRWQSGRTGWHEEAGNAGLRAHWPELAAGSRVLVPLCGKSPDILWLAEQGYAVIGVELSDIAISSFFAENGIKFHREHGEHFDCYSATGRSIALYCGDYFQFETAPCDALYDRGAMIAMSHNMRPAYIERTRALLKPGSTKLIITLEYDQSVVSGPPYAVLPREIREYWSDLRRVDEIDDLENCPPKFHAAGIKAIQEVVWLSTEDAGSF